MDDIRRVGVIGAGVMGAGIAAHIANAGVPVLLLDVAAEGTDGRDAVARAAIRTLQKADPAPFMHPDFARLVSPGTVEDDLDRLGRCDWIVEAVPERLEIKRALYRRIERVRRPGSVVSSNTSTLPLAALTEGQSAAFAADFLVTHFFNPPRYMRLLELVGGPDTRPDAAEAVRRFADRRLGKTVVECRDRPGFIANRLGVFWLQCALAEAFALGLEVQEADAVLGKPWGIPKTGVFGLLDLVGIDLVPQVGASLAAALPPGDPFHALPRDMPLIARMVAEGRTGRKGAGGFYRLNRAGGGKVKEAIALATGAYRPGRAPDLDSLAEAGGDLRALLGHPDKGGRYAWRVMGRTLAYAASLVPEVADDPAAVDEAMRLGYNWSEGPFALIDRLGAGWLAERLETEGWPVPPLLGRAAALGGIYREEAGSRRVLGADGGYRDATRPDGVLSLADVKRAGTPVLRNPSAALWDVGDGVACFEFTTKMNTIDPDTLALLGKAVGAVQEGFRALVIHNEGKDFSAGANLGLALFAANIAAWGEIAAMVEQGQRTYRALKYAPFPVVGAPSGLALGGGCEILLHCDAVQAHAETYMGLVECGVGLIPAWGGCTAMLARRAAAGRPQGPMPPVIRAFETIGAAKVAKSAAEARDLGFLGPDDGITMNRDRLLADAKAKALELARDYAPPAITPLTLPGPAGRIALDMAARQLARRGLATAHDLVVAGALAEVLSGGGADHTRPVEEEAVLALERAHFLALIRHPATLARIEHVLETGKPLRN